MVSSEVDISQLALNRQPEPQRKGIRLPRSFVARYLLPGFVLLGFAGLFLYSAGDFWAPRIKVKVIPVVLQKGTVQAAGVPLFKAAGWVEPRPTAISVPSLNSGVLEELLVVEGQEVIKGTVIARLNSQDVQLALEDAKSVVKQAEASLRQVEAERDAAKTRRDLPVHIDVMIAEANGSLATVKTQLAKLPYLLEAAQAQKDYAQASFKGKKAAGSAIPGVVLEQAKSSLAAADAEVRELVKRKSSLEQEVGALEKKMEALKTQRRLLIEENRQFQEAEAKVQLAGAVLQQKRILLKKAQLDFDRTSIKAPVAGRVLRLVTFPGDRVVGITSGGDGNSTVVELYQPSKLQVRADVRLEDLPNVSKGQDVQIETASSKTPIKGRVLQVNSKANIQKNTLQVKVEVIDPPPVIRPEMLVTATFLSQERESTDTSVEQSLVTLPNEVVKKDGEQSFVWIAGPNDRAVKRVVEVVPSSGGKGVVIQSGIQATDKVVAEADSALTEGCLIQVKYE